MQISITLKDKGANTVSYDMETVVPDTETAENVVTPAGVLALAIKALFNNGMLADMGQHALSEAANGVSPEESIRQKYDNPNT